MFSAVAYLNIFVRTRFKEAVSKSQQNYQTLLDASPDGVVVHQQGNILYANDSLAGLLNFSSKEKLIGKSIHQFLLSEDYDKVESSLEEIMQGLDKDYREERLPLANNTSIDVEVANIVTTYNEAPAIMTILRDIRKRKKMEKDLGEAEDKYRKIIESSLMGVYLFQEDTFLYVNKYIEDMLGYSFSELNKINYLELLKPDDRQEIQGLKNSLLSGTSEVIKELQCVRKDGTTIYAQLNAKTIEYNDKPAVLGMILDITDRKNSEREIIQMALYDSLTGLPNRYFLASQLNDILREAKATGFTFAVLFIDLDGFKLINDTMGHSFGDDVLKSVSQEIKCCLQEDDFISRYGGDEFVIIIKDTSDYSLNNKVLKVMESLSTPLAIRGHEILITPSIGISLSPKDSDDAETLIKYADSAMYLAKAKGRNTFVYFSKELHAAMTRRIQLENGLRKALENEEFMLYYQSQIDLRSGSIYGAEALIRWKHPIHDIVPPDEFIPLAEETGMISAIGEWVLKTACTQCKAWHEGGLPLINVSVNVSNKQLIDRSFVNTVKRALEDSGLEPQYLDLEVTESILMKITEISPVLEELKQLGVRISIDDFGVGYSSLSLLQNLTINSIKIDRSFTASVLDNPKSAAIVKTTIAMGENLDTYIIAEGVETSEQMNFLKQNGCHIGQGYLFNRPTAAEEFEKFLGDFVYTRK